MPEKLDPSLGAGSTARAGGIGPRGWWVSHEELHADRVLLFIDEFAPGRHVHSIPVLAATPGQFMLPAAVAEGMYAPEVHARTTRQRLEVRDLR